MEKAGDPKGEGIRICAELIEQLQQIDGVNLALSRAAANLTRAAAHLQNPDKSTARSLQMLRRYTHHHDELCCEEVEHVARALERGPGAR